MGVARKGVLQEGPRQEWGQRPLTRLSVNFLQILIIGSFLSVHPLLFIIYIVGVHSIWEGKAEGHWCSACTLSAQGGPPASVPLHLGTHPALPWSPAAAPRTHSHTPGSHLWGQIRRDSRVKGRPGRGWREVGAIPGMQSPTQRRLCTLLTLGDIHVIFTRLHCGNAIAVQLLEDTQPGDASQKTPTQTSRSPKHSLPPQYRKNVHEK